MKPVEKQFVEAIEERLKALQTNAFAVEKAAGLPADAIRNVLRAKNASGPTLSRVSEICEALDLELYFGKPRDVAPPPQLLLDGERFAAVPRYETELAAGAGRLNEDEQPVEHLAFNRAWLERMGVVPGDACLLSVKGDSMSPALSDGDLVLIDRRRSSVRDRRVYAFVDLDGLARVKRLELVPGEMLILSSDNPASQTEFRRGDEMNQVAILGEVVWSGHTWRSP